MPTMRFALTVNVAPAGPKEHPRSPAVVAVQLQQALEMALRTVKSITSPRIEPERSK